MLLSSVSHLLLSPDLSPHPVPVCLVLNSALQGVGFPQAHCLIGHSDVLLTSHFRRTNKGRESQRFGLLFFMYCVLICQLDNYLVPVSVKNQQTGIIRRLACLQPLDSLSQFILNHLHQHNKRSFMYMCTCMANF